MNWAVPPASVVVSPDVGLTAIFDALRFAAVRHSRQRRKDVDESPYINHPIALTRVLKVEAVGLSKWFEGHGQDSLAIFAAGLSDDLLDPAGQRG